MFPKCSLDVTNITTPNIATLNEHSTNIPGLLRAGWVSNITTNDVTVDAVIIVTVFKWQKMDEKTILILQSFQ